MTRIALLTGLCLSLAALGACSANTSGRSASGAGESASIGQESSLLTQAPAADPAAGAAAGTAAAGPSSRAPLNSGPPVSN
jgi:hypothetical protein